MKKRLLFWAIGLMSVALNWSIFYWLALKIGSREPQFITAMVIISVLMHEFSHMLVYEANGVATTFFMFVIFAGACPISQEECKKIDRLPLSTRATVALAGVIGNIAVTMGGLVAWHMCVLTHDQFLSTCTFNGMLIAYNLLPIWKLDGCRFTSYLFSGSTHRQNRWIACCIVCALATTNLAAISLWGKSSLLPYLVTIWGLHKRNSRRSSGNDTANFNEPIREKDRFCWAALYTSLVIAGYLILATTPERWLLN